MTGARDTVPNNLPAPLSSFVGREREIADIGRLLGQIRLLTLTGAGGCGKSRLGLEAARSIVGRFSDGLWLVELAPLTGAHLVAQATAAVLSLPEQPGRAPVDALVSHLRTKSVLVVLDNCEHVLPGCVELAGEVLRSCPGVRVLATSREALGVPGETIYRVPPLSTPDQHALVPPERLLDYEAVRLFVERAGSVQAGYRVTAANAPAIAQVCRRLDGMPLAIELAAARTKALTAEQITARLDDRFRLLTGGGRTALPQHRTLRAAIEWSYDLLSDNERALLPRLSVFAGGWSLDAAEAVCTDGTLPSSDILDLLAQLVDKSLVIADISGAAARYHLLETVRQYGRERLSETETADVVRDRHLNWYLDLAERADPALRGPDQAGWFQRLEFEHDNLRAALEWSLVDGRPPDAGPRLAWALVWFWQMRDHAREGRDWLEKMADRGGTVPAALRAQTLCGAGQLSEKLGDYAHARTRLDESLAMFRQLGDERGTGIALHHLAHVARAQGDLDGAVRMFEQSLVLFRGARDKWGCALTLDCWGGTLIALGDYDGAAALHQESVVLFREIGDALEVPGPLSGLGIAAAARGDTVRAVALLEESFALARALHGSDGGVTTSMRLGRVLFDQGEYARSAALFKDSMTRRLQRGDRDGVAACLRALGGVAVARRQFGRAARLFGAAETLRDALRTIVPPAQRARHEQHLAAVRAGLDEQAFAAAWTEGASMGIEEAVAFAAEQVEAGPGPLTAREREVAGLVADGLTNREIATRLVIAERTAEGHVQSILNKLSFDSRAQIAAWAVERGLTTARMPHP